MEYIIRGVPGIGDVAVTKHARERLQASGISAAKFEKVLLEPIKPDTFDGLGTIWRERDGVRIVIIDGADLDTKVVKTVYRVLMNSRAS